MFDVAGSLQHGFADAEVRLRHAQAEVADANAGRGGRSADAAMAQTAQIAIFEETLLAAVHARLSELKAATR